MRKHPKMPDIVEPFIDIVFDGPPGHESGRFVEVEDHEGKRIRAGEWLQRADGYWVLRFRSPAPQSVIDVAIKNLDYWSQHKHGSAELQKDLKHAAGVIRNLAAQSAEDGEGLREAMIKECAKVADNATRQVCRGDFGLVGPAGIGMKIAQAIRALSGGRDRP